MICRFCTARINNEVTICDSCGLAPTEGGALMLTSNQINDFEVTCCMSCGKLIPEKAAACKYCMGIQPLTK